MSMFSGLTNQVSSWMGAVKGEPHDEEVPPPPPGSENTAPAPVAAAAPPAPQAGSDPAAEGEEGAKSGGMFSNVKGWLGSASASIPSMPAMPAMPAMSMPSMPAMPSIPVHIPGLSKTNEEGAEGEATATGEEDDKSRYISATEGADSNPASDELGEEGKIGHVTTKVTEGAKHFGSFLYSSAAKVGSKIKETAKAAPILDTFNKEQEAFIKGQSKPGEGALPWIGRNSSDKVKEEIFALSQDRRNFVRAPPAGVDFEFSYDLSYPTAQLIMAEDPSLEKMRFELVPKIITEEQFWRNYFYRVSLICQAADLGTLGGDGGLGAASSGEDASYLQ